MVATTITLNLGNTESLDVFDTMTHMAFGDGTTTPSQGDTTLTNELLRVSLVSKTKDTGNNTYTFIGRVPITQLNSDTINELGLFDASTGGNMGAKVLSPIAVTKTSDDEILFTLRIKVETINN